MPQKIIDADFGTMEFSDIEGRLSFDCQVALPISSRKVDVFFATDSDRQPPTPEQKQFLHQIVDTYDSILQSIAQKLPEEMPRPESNKGDFLKEEFDLDTLGVPLQVANRPQWDLSLVNRRDKTIHILANFENMTPTNIWLERSKKSFLLKLLEMFSGR